MYTISFFKSTYEAYVMQSDDISLEDLGHLLTQEVPITDDKHSVPLFSLTRFKTVEEGAVPGQRNSEIIPNTVRRCKENAVSISGLILDFDGGATIEQVLNQYDGLYMIIYTTYSNSLQKEKFRVVIPFTQAITIKEFEAKIKDMSGFFTGCDQASFSVSQCFFLPCVSKQNQHLMKTLVINGNLLDTAVFEEELIEVSQPFVSTTNQSDELVSVRYKHAVVDALFSCSGAHYRGQQDPNDGVLTLVAICRSIGLTFDEYDQICSSICDPSSSLKEASKRRNAWQKWDGNKITREKRDAYIRANKGRAIKYLTQETTVSTTLKATIKNLRNKT